MPKATKELWEGVRSLEEISGLEFLGDPEPLWDDYLHCWVLSVALKADVPPDGPVAPTTSWHVLIDERYPIGPISIFPSKEGGLVQTFPHQHFNGAGLEGSAWRNGNICPERSTAALHHLGFGNEPRSPSLRLSWLLRRAISWLEHASRGDLVRDGDPFELPDYPARSKIRVALGESRASLETWRGCGAESGLARLVRLPGDGSQLVIVSFEDARGRELLRVPWGRYIQEHGEEVPIAMWMRAQRVPVLEPWQAPSTWSELAEALGGQGLDFWEGVRELAARLREPASKTKRPVSPQLLLIGSPIPETIGGPDARMHWLAIELASLARGRQFPDGFRANEQGWWEHDRRRVFAPHKDVPWATSESWASREIGSRGYLSEDLRARRTVLLGAGALGSALAELLVRAGLRDLAVFDGDELEAGNLVRHSLLLSDLGAKKTLRLADRLNACSPHAGVRGFAESFPPSSEDGRRSCAEAELVIDCTASDDVLDLLESFAWEETCLLTSFALGFQGARLFCFAARGGFRAGTYRRHVGPWLLAERSERGAQDLPWEGVGCWHPVFPARIDDVWTMASVACKFLLETDGAELDEPRFRVYESHRDSEEAFAGIRRGWLKSDDVVVSP